MRDAIEAALVAAGEMSLKHLRQEEHRRIAGKSDGSFSWCVTRVKLDLEAKGIIERVPSRTPRRLRLGQEGS
jgi:hypothetical protein